MKGFESGFSYLHTLTQECGMCGANTTDDQLVQALRGLIKFAGRAYMASLKEEVEASLKEEVEATKEEKDVGSSDQKPEGDTPQDD